MKVGDYVRNENGLIGKIIGFKGDMVEIDNKRLITYKSNHSECKIKERPIDLIQVGDYVNDKRVTDIDTVKKKIYVEEMYYFNKKDIKSIVTKEQFESMEYKVGE